MCFDFGIISGPIIAGLAYIGGGSAPAGAAIVSTAATVASTAVTAVAQNQAAKAQEAGYKYNAEIEQQKALDAKRRGSMAEAEHRTQAKRIVAAYRAEQGPSGVVADAGSNLDILAQSAEYGGRDAATARINAGREAFGYESQSVLDKYGGSTARSIGAGRVAGTALTGASQVFQQASPWWTTWKPTNPVEWNPVANRRLVYGPD